MKLLLVSFLMSFANAGILKTGDDENKCMYRECPKYGSGADNFICRFATCRVNEDTCDLEWYYTLWTRFGYYAVSRIPDYLCATHDPTCTESCRRVLPFCPRAVRCVANRGIGIRDTNHCAATYFDERNYRINPYTCDPDYCPPGMRYDCKWSNVCEAKCKKYPEAKCEVISCRGCHALYRDKNNNILHSCH